MPNILSQWAARMEYNLYYSKYLKCAEKYVNPYVLVYDVYHLTETDWMYMWADRWTAHRNCTTICIENLYEWVVCDESDAIKLLLVEPEHIVDHYHFSKYAELVKMYCEFKEHRARQLVLNTKKTFPSYRALDI
jgi:hypothetical protein